MYAMVIYDSQYGNTARIARAIGDVIRVRYPVDVQPVAEVGALSPGLDLLVIGGPTQGHGLSPAMKAFLDNLPDEAVRGVDAAVFDTRLQWPVLLSGSAAKGIARQLEQKGANLVAEPESFFVAGKEGPLAEGEIDHADTWTRRVTAGMLVAA